MAKLKYYDGTQWVEVESNIPNNSLTEAKMANEMKKGVVGGVESYDDALAHKADYTQLKGDLSTLKTTAKDSIPNIVNELFTNVSDGKGLIATAITDKGYAASSSETFNSLSTKIRNIETGDYSIGDIIDDSSLQRIYSGLSNTLFSLEEPVSWSYRNPEGQFYVFNVNTMKLKKISSTGSVIWSHDFVPLEGSGRIGVMFEYLGYLYVVESASGASAIPRAVSKRSTSNGSIIWRDTLTGSQGSNASPYSALFSGGYFYIALGSNGLVRYNTDGSKTYLGNASYSISYDALNVRGNGDIVSVGSRNLRIFDKSGNLIKSGTFSGSVSKMYVEENYGQIVAIGSFGAFTIHDLNSLELISTHKINTNQPSVYGEEPIKYDKEKQLLYARNGIFSRYGDMRMVNLSGLVQTDITDLSIYHYTSTGVFYKATLESTNTTKILK